MDRNCKYCSWICYADISCGHHLYFVLVSVSGGEDGGGHGEDSVHGGGHQPGGYGGHSMLSVVVLSILVLMLCT